MKQNLLIFLLLISSPIISLSPVKAAETAMNTEIQWQTYDQALLTAKQTQRSIYIQFHANWCRYCQQLARESYSRIDVQQLLNKKFVPVQVLENDTKIYALNGQNYTAQDLLVGFRVSSFPTLAFLNAQGQLIGVIPGYVESDDFKLLLEFIASEAYLTTDFDLYRQQQRQL
jgi:thioredoxin-related protein